MITERIKELRKVLEDNTAFIVTSNENRFYLSGFNSSAGCVVITKNTATLLIDFRYYEKASAKVSHLNVKLCTKLYDDIKEILKAENIKNVQVETSSVTLNQFAQMKKALADFNISEEPILSRRLCELRQIKTPQEIELIKEAQKITDDAFSYILDHIRTGRTEREIALELEFFMRKQGSEGVAFDTIAVSGKNSSLPHGVPTDKPLCDGDFLTLDFGAVFGGYRSDMTRTVALGFVTDEQKQIYDIVLKAQTETLKAIKPSKPCCEIDKIARDVISDAGYGEYFGHGLGHSVGIEIHESPACNTRDTTPLKKGMIMTVEPGIYLPNKFGVRIEDMVVVTDDGIENLTKSPKGLMIF